MLIVATGNVSNATLLNLLDRHLDTVVTAFTDANFVELRNGELVVHQQRGG